MKNVEPALSIITVCYNALEDLKGTLASVDAQTASDFEYIVIDGGSTDGTPAYLASQMRVDQYVSEPDRGLYDAMNKGIQMARGKMIWFMNAGDRLMDSDTVNQILSVQGETVDVIYGEVMLVDENRRHLGTRSELSVQVLPKDLDWKSMRFGMRVCHQAFIVRRSIVPLYMDNNLTADIDWVIRCLKKANQVVNTDCVLAEYLQGGISKQHHKQSMLDRYEVLKSHFGFFPNIVNHAWILVRAQLFKIQRWGKPRY